MPRTVLSITTDEKKKLALLQTQCAELPVFDPNNTELFERTLTEHPYMKKRVAKEAKRRFCHTVINHLRYYPRKVFEILQAKNPFENLTGEKQAYYPKDRTENDNMWREVYVHLFNQWLEDNDLDTFKSWGAYPKHLAGWYHLNHYGDQDLKSLDFDGPMGLALLNEVLHDHGVTTLKQLAALTLPELHQHMKASGYDNPDEQLTLLRKFLYRYHIEINTILEVDPVSVQT